jgi:hypothetical protein
MPVCGAGPVFWAAAGQGIITRAVKIRDVAAMSAFMDVSLDR